jgi:hypothetical protein
VAELQFSSDVIGLCPKLFRYVPFDTKYLFLQEPHQENKNNAILGLRLPLIILATCGDAPVINNKWYCVLASETNPFLAYIICCMQG